MDWIHATEIVIYITRVVCKLLLQNSRCICELRDCIFYVNKRGAPEVKRNLQNSANSINILYFISTACKKLNFDKSTEKTLS